MPNQSSPYRQSIFHYRKDYFYFPYFPKKRKIKIRKDEIGKIGRIFLQYSYKLTLIKLIIKIINYTPMIQ